MVPTLQYFCVPTESSDPTDNHSEKGLKVSANEFKTQVSHLFVSPMDYFFFSSF